MQLALADCSPGERKWASLLAKAGLCSLPGVCRDALLEVSPSAHPDTPQHKDARGRQAITVWSAPCSAGAAWCHTPCLSGRQVIRVQPQPPAARQSGPAKASVRAGSRSSCTRCCWQLAGGPGRDRSRPVSSRMQHWWQATASVVPAPARRSRLAPAAAPVRRRHWLRARLRGARQRPVPSLHLCPAPARGCRAQAAVRPPRHQCLCTWLCPHDWHGGWFQ